MSELPAGWRVVALDKVTRHKSGNSKLIKGTLLPAYSEGAFPAFSATGQDVWRDEFEHTGEAVIISAVGARCGKCFLASGQWSAIANTHIVWPDSNVLDCRFLWYMINDEDYWVKGGSAQPFIKVRASLERETILPPLDVQRAIVEKIDGFLERSQGAHAKLQRVLHLQTRLKEALSHSLFFAPSRHELGDWKVMPVRDIVSWGPQNGLYLPKSQYGRGTPIVRIDDFQNNWIRKRDTLRLVAADKKSRDLYSLKAGDIVINRVNSLTHLGKLFVVPEELDGCVFESNMMRYRVDTTIVSPEWIAQFLMSPEGIKRLRKNAKWAVNQASINQDDVLNVIVSVPPLLKQHSILSKLRSGVNAAAILEGETTKALALTKRLAKAAVAAALRGGGI